MSGSEKLTLNHIFLSSDQNQLMIKFTHISTIVKQKHLIHLLQHPTLPSFKINIAGVEEAVSAFDNLHNNPDVELSDFLPVAIADKQDAQLNLVIAKDEMSAYAEIKCAYGGKNITLSEIKECCADININFGLIPKSILALINTCKKAKAGKFYRINIATGTPPQNGIDASFKKIVQTDNHRKHSPQLLPNGKVDMHNLGKTITVKPNTLLMKKYPATKGEPGKTVTGQRIQQVEGVDTDFILSENVHLSPNNDLHLLSSIQGIPIEDNDFIRIDDVLLLKDIDIKTGDIDYDGSVVITGDIHEGMKINVTGDITVMGFIESAYVYCGGDLTVKKAIIGRVKQQDHEFCCEIHCKGTLRGTIARYAHIEVGKEIEMSDQLMHCFVKCNDSVLVHNESLSKGSIIGGELHANGKVVTTSIGTDAGSRTLIDLNANYNILASQKKKLTHYLQKVDGIIEKFHKAQSRADSILDIKQQKTTKKKLAKEKQIYRGESDKIQVKLSEIKLLIDTYHTEVNVAATIRLHSDTTVKIGGKIINVVHEHGPSNVSIIENKLQVIPLT